MKTMFPLIAAILVAMPLAAGAGPTIDPVPHPASGSESYLRAHQDLRWRREGIESFDAGRFEDALAQFTRAARFGDKPSQGMVAEMYWRGEGVPQDRARAYAWMDLAAERQYKALVAKREYYWARLSAAEQARAIGIGKLLYADYGDAVAIPRMDRLLTRARREITGSRVGFVHGPMKVMARFENGEFGRYDANAFYDRQYWDPKVYHAWKDAFFERPFNGQVDVGALRRAQEAKEE